VYARGEKYYREGKLATIQAKRQGRETVIKAAVKGNYRNYDVSLKFEGEGILSQYTCDCASQSIWKGACKHIVTVLFALADGRNPYGDDRMSIDQDALADTLEKLIFQEIDEALEVTGRAENGRLAKLTPRFHCAENGEAYLTFYVGYSRMYVVRHLHRFIQAVVENQTVRYGNGLEFNHAPDSFNALARRWIGFLQNEDRLYQEMAKRLGRTYPSTGKDDIREIHLSERNMDTVFDLCENTSIEGDVSFFLSDARVRFTSDMPRINFDVTYGADEVVLRGPTSLPYKLLKGQKYNYLLLQCTIHRMKVAEAKLLEHLLNALAEHGQMVFAGYAYQRFVSVILPKLRKMGVVVLEASHLEPDLHTKMYFDYEDGNVTARVVFEYGASHYNAFDSASTLAHPRDIAGEYTLKQLLRSLGFVPDVLNNVFRLAGDDALFTFMGDSVPGIERLKEYGEVYIADSLKKRTIRGHMGSIGVRLKGSLLDVYVHEAEFSLSDLIEALASYKEKKKYHLLKDGRLLSLTDERTIVMADTLTALDVELKDLKSGKLTLPSYRAPYVENRVLQHDAAFRKLMRSFHSRDSVKVPKSLEKVLRPYQKVGYQWLKALSACGFGGILADDMGLGKTLQVIALLVSEWSPEDYGKPSLVVVPTSLLYNWSAELKKYAPNLSTMIVSGSSEKRKELLQTPNVDIFITTYETMKRDAEVYDELQYRYVIADEAQNIKNPATKNARVIKSIQADCRFAMTGTPIENTLSELWSLFDFVMPGYLYTASKFGRMYETPIVKDNDKEKAARLRQQIAPFILRRVKRNVLHELPPKTETTLMAELLPEQHKIYTAHLMQAKGELNKMLAEPAKRSRIQILAQLTRLRQICCHPSLCVENYRGGSGKLDLVLETIPIAIESGHRCLLFSQFTEMLRILKTALQEADIKFFYLDGSTPAHERMERVQRFNAGEKDVFLISLKAGGTGLNLTGADVVIHYDPWWNPSVMEQASDRAYRMGQERSVQVFNLVTMNTLEERILELQEQKKKLIDAVLEEENTNFMKPLTDAELELLLEPV